MSVIVAQPLTREAFTPFGDVIETEGADHFLINNGHCQRFHALATTQALGPEAQIIINIFRAKAYAFPLTLNLVERHPFGSQAFIPLSQDPFLVVVAHDEGGRPGLPHAFLTRPGQGVNYPANLWHGVLTPIAGPQDFVVVDRTGQGNNLEEFHFPAPYEVRLP